MAGYDNPRERGIRRVYHGRAKIGGFPPFKGMHRPSDAGVIGDDEFDWLQNMRLDGGGHLQSRGGQAKKFTTNIGTVAGIFEAGELGDPTARTVAPTVPGGTAVIPATLAPTGVQGFYDQWVAGPLAGYGSPGVYTKPVAVTDDVTGDVSPLWGNVPIGTYIHQPTTDNTKKDSFIISAIPDAVDTITKVVVRVNVHWNGNYDDEGGHSQLILGVRLGGVDSLSAPFRTNPVGGWAATQEEWDATAARPGGGAWVAGDLVGGLECIIGATRTFPNNTFGPFVDKLRLIVTYTRVR
jgi:hypothetical protein